MHHRAAVYPISSCQIVSDLHVLGMCIESYFDGVALALIQVNAARNPMILLPECS